MVVSLIRMGSWDLTAASELTVASDLVPVLAVASSLDSPSISTFNFPIPLASSHTPAAVILPSYIASQLTIESLEGGLTWEAASLGELSDLDCGVPSASEAVTTVAEGAGRACAEGSGEGSGASGGYCEAEDEGNRAVGMGGVVSVWV